MVRLKVVYGDVLETEKSYLSNVWDSRSSLRFTSQLSSKVASGPLSFLQKIILAVTESLTWSTRGQFNCSFLYLKNNNFLIVFRHIRFLNSRFVYIRTEDFHTVEWSSSGQRDIHKVCVVVLNGASDGDVPMTEHHFALIADFDFQIMLCVVLFFEESGTVTSWNYFDSFDGSEERTCWNQNRGDVHFNWTVRKCTRSLVCNCYRFRIKQERCRIDPLQSWINFMLIKIYFLT